MITVYLANKKKTIEIEAKTVMQLLEKLGYFELEVLVIDRKNKILLTPDQHLKNIKEIEIKEVMGR